MRLTQLTHLVTRSTSLALLLLVSAISLEAQQWDPFPRLAPGAHSAVQRGLDERPFRGLEPCLQGFDSAAGASYYAAVVRITDPRGRSTADSGAAIEYVDALAGAWSDRLGERDVVIAVAIDNRAFAAHPGDALSRLGFEGEMVSLTLETSGFADLARRGRFGDAICRLVSDIDRTLAGLVPAASNAAPNIAPGVAPDAAPDARSSIAPKRVPTRSSRAAEASLSEADGTHWSILLFPLAFLAAVILWLLDRRRRAARAKANLENEVERWQHRLSNAADQLLELENRHPLYFTAEQRWTGESLELDRQCAQLVNRTYQLYSKAHQILQRCQEVQATGSAWKSTAYDEGWRLLHEEPVILDAGEIAGGRVAVDNEDAFHGKAATLLEDLDTSYRGALEQLASVAALEDAYRDVAQRADQAATDATTACTERAELGLPTEHLTAQLGPALNTRRRLKNELATDPKRAIGAFEQVVAELRRTADQAATGNHIISTLRGDTTARLATLRDRISQLRDEGWSMAEPGFDPDLRLDRGERQALDIERSLAQGEEEQAAAEHESLIAGLTELGAMIDTAIEARQELQLEVQRLEDEVGLLRQRLPGARRTLQALGREHAATAFENAGDNLEELVPVLDEIEGWIAHIRDDYSEQRYLSAVEDVTTAHRRLADGNALIDELEHTAEALAAQQKQARTDLETAASRAERLRQLRGEPGLPRPLTARVEALMKKLEQVSVAADDAKPHWSDVAGSAADVEGELEHLEQIVKVELAAFSQAMSQKPALDERMQQLASAAGQEQRDRQHVDRAVEDAQALFDAWKHDLENGSIGGRALLERSREVANRLSWADKIWHSELGAIQQATTELRAAEYKLKQEDRRAHGHGVFSDCHRGRSLLEQAREASNGRQWERTLALAHEASEAIDDDARRARREAEHLEDTERRRLQAHERRRKLQMAASVAQAALQTAAVIAAGHSGRGRHRSWPSAGTSASNFGHRRRKPKKGSRSGGSGWGNPSGGSGW